MQKEELERMKDVLHDFMDYMEDPYGTVDALGANCYNTGWNDIDQDDIYYKEQTVADVVRCRLLTRALWFANGDNTQHKNANGGSAHMSADEERLRCDVVNAFGYILHHKYCAHKTAWTRGIKYAWKTVKSMGDPGGIKGADRGPVIDARCTECGYDIKNPVVRVVNGHMAQLLIHEGNLMHKIGQLERTAHCAMQWKDYKSGPGRTDGNGNVDWKNIPEVTKTEKEIVQKTQAAIQEVTAKIDEEIEKKKSEQDKGKDTNTTPAEAKKKNEDGKKSTDASTKDQSTEKAQLPAAPVLPARPPPPAPPPGQQTPKDSRDSSSRKYHVSGDTSTCGIHTHSETKEVNGSTATITITTVNSPSTGCSGSGTSGNDPSAVRTTTSQDPSVVTAAPAPGPVPPAETESAPAPQPHPTNSAPASPRQIPGNAAGQDDTEPAKTVAATPASPPSSGTALTTTSSGGGGGKAGSALDGAHGTQAVDGGNHDPSPLNPPPPKPNPNPNQSGSSGSFSDADLANGVSGGNGQAGAAGGAPGRAGAGGSSGGGGRGGERGSGTEVGTPSVPPGLRWEDVIPYTLALIPAVVGIGVIAFVLWKYFTHLAPRRRTYRTVRDVPSPPLDEEILQHLQRGELPPPDYGYTVVRDRPPASTSARARPPRVHKRTIIELHLEVLHECEVAAWENVKDDYLHILVEEFMAGHNTCTSSSNVCTRDDGLATQDSTTNADSPTRDTPSDSEQTDPCRPHNPDPWSCMEIIQLATDPCAPHDDDRWSCMETIQLDHAQHRPSDNGDATSACTQWINWIDHHKHLLHECMTQPWFNALKTEWKQYLREHMAADANNGQRALGERFNIPSAVMKKDAWKKWLDQQHRNMRMYNALEWFPRLLHNVQEHTESHKGAVPVVGKDLEVEKAMGPADIRRVRDVPRSQLHQQPHMKTVLTAKIWILILALVIEHCEVDSRLQQTELYVDHLLQNC
ncbi:hypothetical protein AK88_04942 [Plasmodium fragile]|uniref:Schizont-infected cell agglutination C-terminal domain-containing protein n=1 Tax=Plasmodium fragile TaxID=5857 RepID=A0A0D9QEM2_PLAFR|nr:uncharacterized protein AK88_04942 [Plasmodium fragile]KJP85439.1 hypothetical protein AK88_04942 [Plasmodium fragile]